MRGALLALESSTPMGSVAVGDGVRLLSEVTLGMSGQHSTALAPAVDAAVRWAGYAPRDLGGVVVGGGPGSFTGLRIAAATAKGVVYALDVPLWSYSGLLTVAAECAIAKPRREALVCALFDARRRDVYAACYRFVRAEDGLQIVEVFAPEALPIEALLARFREAEVPIFTGEAALTYAPECERELGAAIAPPHLSIPRASALLWLQRVAPELGRVADRRAWEPEYVRASGAERIAAARPVEE